MQLKKEILELIRSDEALASNLGKAMDINLLTVIRFTYRNSRRLTEYGSLKIIADHIGKGTEELVEENTDSTETVDKVESISE